MAVLGALLVGGALSTAPRAVAAVDSIEAEGKVVTIEADRVGALPFAHHRLRAPGVSTGTVGLVTHTILGSDQPKASVRYSAREIEMPV